MRRQTYFLQRLGSALFTASFVGLFWWGNHFRVFGTAIDFVGRPIAYGGFFGWVVLMVFGGALVTGRLSVALKAAAGMILILALALGVGILRGAYR